MPTIQSPRELLNDQIRDLFSVEEQVAETMPELAACAPEPALRDFLARQQRISKQQTARLREVAGLLGSDAGGDESKAMKGLIEGGNRHIQQAQGSTVTGLILVAHVNRVIYYQIAGYGFATALAKCLQLDQTHELLSASLDDECQAAETLAVLSVELFGAVTENQPAGLSC